MTFRSGYLTINKQTLCAFCYRKGKFHLLLPSKTYDTEKEKKFKLQQYVQLWNIQVLLLKTTKSLNKNYHLSKNPKNSYAHRSNKNFLTHEYILEHNKMFNEKRKTKDRIIRLITLFNISPK